MIILNEFDTIRLLRETKGSISRYGDGEFNICTGGNAKSQVGDTRIMERLVGILRSDLPNHIVGIPRIYEERSDYCNEAKKEHWQKYTRPMYKTLLGKNKTYGSAFITRPDSATGIDSDEYFKLVKSLWAGKEVLLLRGEHAGFDKDPGIFDVALDVQVLVGPDRDAFAEYSYLLNLTVSNSNPNTVIVLSLGPTATVLAYDLCELGRQALDLGHFGMFYAKIHPKGSNYNADK